jgi:hypothetical protein
MSRKHYSIYKSNSSYVNFPTTYKTNEHSWNIDDFEKHYANVSNPTYPFGNCPVPLDKSMYNEYCDPSGTDPSAISPNAMKNKLNKMCPGIAGFDVRPDCIITPQGGIDWSRKTPQYQSQSWTPATKQFLCNN